MTFPSRRPPKAGASYATLNNATYNLTFDRARAVRLDGDHITLAVETEFARCWVMQRYQPVLKDALFEVLGTDIGVDVLVSTVTSVASFSARARPSRPPRAMP